MYRGGGGGGGGSEASHGGRSEAQPERGLPKVGSGGGAPEGGVELEGRLVGQNKDVPTGEGPRFA